MSIESTLARVAELNGTLSPQPSSSPSPTPSGGAFAGALQQALGAGSPLAAAAGAAPRGLMGGVGGPFSPGAPPGAASPLAALGAGQVATPGAYGWGNPRAAIVAAAQGEVGQAEQPPGSNDSPRIAMYRTATAGAMAGAPWCGYFVSWAARQAGVPLGDAGQGSGSVDQLWAWGQRNGRAMPAGATPYVQPGDLIFFPQHVGIVEAVLPDGRIQTIEGNHSDRVDRVLRSPGEWTGFVRVA